MNLCITNKCKEMVNKHSACLDVETTSLEFVVQYRKLCMRLPVKAYSHMLANTKLHAIIRENKLNCIDFPCPFTKLLLPSCLYNVLFGTLTRNQNHPAGRDKPNAGLQNLVPTMFFKQCGYKPTSGRMGPTAERVEP